MKLGLMQPYFYPFLGYWQLINMVDEYIIYDDVHYIKGGWINRNNIKIGTSAGMLGFSVSKASQNKIINELEIFMTPENRERLMKKMYYAYARAPYSGEVLKLFEDAIYYDKTNLAEFLNYSIRKTAEYMGIETPILSATELQLDHTHRGQQRIIDICHERGAGEYINSIGGKALYSNKDFEEAGLKIGFLKMDSDIVYPQGKGDFIPSLSILDVLMYNSRDEVRQMLNRYTIESDFDIR